MPKKSRGGDGSLSRRAALLLVGGGGLMAVSGTGAFTQVDAGRPFSVQSASDENALLGIETFEVSYKSKTRYKKILELENRVGSTLDITVNSSHSFLEIKPVGDLKPDTSASVTAKAKKERSDSSSVELTITAESETTSITATRTITIGTDIGSSVPDACPINPTPSITVSVGNNAKEGPVKNVGSVSKDVDGDVLISNGNDFDITAGSTINISGKIAGSATGNIKLHNDKVGENIAASSGKNITLKQASAVKGAPNKPTVETGSGTIKIQHTTVIGSQSSKPAVKTSNGKVKIIGQNQSNKAVIDGDIVSDQISKIQDAIVSGNVTATGDGIKTQRANIGGDVSTSSGNDASIKDSVVCGTITADGNVKLKNGSSVKGVDVTADGKNVIIKNSSTVTGNISAQSNGTIKVKNRSTVSGNITAGGGSSTKIKIKNQSTVEGNITAGSGCVVTIKATVKGDVKAGTVNISNKGTVEGTVTETT